MSEIGESFGTIAKCPDLDKIFYLQKASIFELVSYGKWRVNKSLASDLLSGVNKGGRIFWNCSRTGHVKINC